MESIEALKKKITTTQELQAVVKTMKALSATNIRQYEQAVESLAEYYQTVAMGLQIILKLKPEETALTASHHTSASIEMNMFNGNFVL